MKFQSEDELRKFLQAYPYKGKQINIVGIVSEICEGREDAARAIIDKRKIDPQTRERLIADAKKVIAELNLTGSASVPKNAEYYKKFRDCVERMGSSLYEYKVISFIDSVTGVCNTEEIQRTINTMGKEGWRVKGVFSNELGKNALMLLGIGLNGTVDQAILIMERDIRFAEVETSLLLDR